MPRLPHSGAAVAALPQPLGPADAELLRRAFMSQAHRNVAAAVRAVADVQDPLLRGTVLADRYLGHHYRSTPAELADWLAHYSDHPEAPAIHALLLHRLPKGAPRPAAPAVVSLPSLSDPDPVPEDIDPPRHDLARNRDIEKDLSDRVERGATDSALRLIARTRGLSAAYAAQLRAEVAQMLFTQNEDFDALRVAQSALSDTPEADQPGLGFYVGGLAAWRLDRLELARLLFEAGAKATNSSAHLHAASALWAARASSVNHDAAAAVKWLRVAAEERLTFHGLLARRILRLDTGIVSGGDMLSQADVDAVAATAAGRRAFALLQLGQARRAEAELQGLWRNVDNNPAFGRSLVMVAHAAGLLDCAAQMARVLQARDGQRHDELRFPMPRLRPAGGFKVDPTLVYALARLESNFDSKAVSPAGARGLLQIMPATAQYMSPETLYTPARLHEASSNLDIGQRYILHLARLEGIDNDLIKLLTSYNSGPGNFGRWGAEIRHRGDPLLFIEAIPVAETRAFVPQALTYSWIYAARLHLPAPSLDSLSEGEFPRFTTPSQEGRMAVVAASGAE